MISLSDNFKNGRGKTPLTYRFSYSLDDGTNWIAVPDSGAVIEPIGRMSQECENPEFTYLGPDIELTCQNSTGFWSKSDQTGLLDSDAAVMVKVEMGNANAPGEYVTHVRGYVDQKTLFRSDTHTCSFTIRGTLNILDAFLANAITSTKLIYDGGSVVDLAPYKFRGVLQIHSHTGGSWQSGVFKLEYNAQDHKARWNNGEWVTLKVDISGYQLKDATGANSLIVNFRHWYSPEINEYIPGIYCEGALPTSDITQWLRVVVVGGVPCIYEPPAFCEAADLANDLSSILTLNVDGISRMPIYQPGINILQKSYNSGRGEHIKYIFGMDANKFLITIADGDKAGSWVMECEIDTTDPTKPFFNVKDLVAFGNRPVVAFYYNETANLYCTVEVANGDTPWAQTWTEGVNLYYCTRSPADYSLGDEDNLNWADGSSTYNYIAANSIAFEPVGALTSMYCAAFANYDGATNEWRLVSYQFGGIPRVYTTTRPLEYSSGGYNHIDVGPWCGGIIPYGSPGDAARRYCVAFTHVGFLGDALKGAASEEIWSMHINGLLADEYNSYSSTNKDCYTDPVGPRLQIIAPCATHIGILSSTVNFIRANLGINKTVVYTDLSSDKTMKFFINTDASDSKITEIEATGSSGTGPFTKEKDVDDSTGNGAIFPVKYLSSGDYNGIALGNKLFANSSDYNLLVRLAEFYNARGRIIAASADDSRRYYAFANADALYIINVNAIEGGYPMLQDTQLNEPDTDGKSMRELLQEYATAANCRILPSEHSAKLSLISKDTIPAVAAVLMRDQYRYSGQWQYNAIYKAVSINGGLYSKSAAVNPDEILNLQIDWLHPDDIPSLARNIYDNLNTGERIHKIYTNWKIEYEPGDCLALQIPTEAQGDAYHNCIVIGCETETATREHLLLLYDTGSTAGITQFAAQDSTIDTLHQLDLNFSGVLAPFIVLDFRTDIGRKYYLKITTAGSTYYLYFNAGTNQQQQFAISTSALGTDLTATSVNLGMCDESGAIWDSSGNVTVSGGRATNIDGSGAAWPLNGIALDTTDFNYLAILSSTSDNPGGNLFAIQAIIGTSSTLFSIPSAPDNLWEFMNYIPTVVENANQAWTKNVSHEVTISRIPIPAPDYFALSFTFDGVGVGISPGYPLSFPIDNNNIPAGRFLVLPDIAGCSLAQSKLEIQGVVVFDNSFVTANIEIA